MRPLNRKLPDPVNGSLECACCMAPQLDSHRHNESLILWETLYTPFMAKALPDDSRPNSRITHIQKKLVRNGSSNLEKSSGR